MNTTMLNLAYGMKIAGEWQPEYEKVMSLEALKFVKQLHERFDDRRKDLLENRMLVQANLNHGWKPTFPEETSEVRTGDWTVAKIPDDLQDRRVEITGPVDRKMIINALNSGAKVFMADFEDSNSPTWINIAEGQINLFDAIRNTIDFENPETGKQYTLNDEVATLMVRPRGLHLVEKHVLIDGEPVSGSLIDFGLYFFNNAKELLAKGSGPYFYLPKLEHYEEARWWNDVFVFAQEQLGIPQGTIKATVLIETILASYQLDEILFELKEHSAGLNCGRWDYIFSFIKRFQKQDGFVFPDRDQVTMAVPFMRAYSQLVIKTCHKRAVHAMGGMAAQIPIKGDDEANRIAFDKVKADKVREASDGHDGTWVAHPGLVHVAMDVFNKYMPNANQIDKKREDVEVTAEDLIAIPEGTITETGVRKNINVGIQYIAAWLSGNGAAAIYHLMEDAATAEISRTQVWQWLHNQVKLDDGRAFTHEVYTAIFETELDILRHTDVMNPAWKSKLEDAAEVFDKLIRDEELKEFLTLEAYPLLD
jgi:malate synthase